jgi:hypothetical protein
LEIPGGSLRTLVKPEKLRRYNRTPLSTAVRLSWEDGKGHLLEVRGKGIDRSPGGLSMEASGSVPVRTLVHVQVEQHGRVGSGYVRHCGRKGVRYHIGVEFTQAAHWKDAPVPPMPTSPAEVVGGNAPLNGGADPRAA